MAKPDQMIKRRGKLGLIKVGTDFAGAKAWIQEKMAANTEVRSLPSLTMSASQFLAPCPTSDGPSAD